MSVYSRREDRLSGNGDETTVPSNGRTVMFSTAPGTGEDVIKSELLRIIAVHEKHDLSQHPEVLAGMLDDLKKKIQGGNILEVLRDPLVYGSISVVLLLVIIMKMRDKKRRK